MARHTKHHERGGIAVMTAAMLVAIFGFTAFAVDLGYKFLKRSQLQTAADTAALSGALALLNYGAQATTLIKSQAVATGQSNLVSDDVPGSALTLGDVELLPDEGDPNQVRVTVYRQDSRGNPLDLFFAKVLGKDTTDVSATATASVLSACSTACMKPFALPDDFEFDDTCDEHYSGNNVLDAKSPCEVASCVSKKFGPSIVGNPITIKYGDPQTAQEHFEPGWYSPVRLPPIGVGPGPEAGGADYEANIASCEGDNMFYPVSPGDWLAKETGVMQGPTKQGFQALYDRDPTATWNGTTVTSTLYPNAGLSNPRVGVIAFYDACASAKDGSTVYASGKAVQVSQLFGIFFKEVKNNDVVGIVVSPDALLAPGSCEGGLLSMVRLEQ